MGLSNIGIKVFNKECINTYHFLKGNESQFIYYVNDNNELYGNDINYFYIYKQFIEE